MAMTETPSEAPATVCDYCGRENTDGQVFCPGCGTRLVTEPEPPAPDYTEPGPKSKLLAVCLTMIFGPLGLIYVGSWGAMLGMMAVALPFLVTREGGLWVTFGFRVLASVWAYCVLVQQDERPNYRRDTSRLLNEAARLESVDRSEAIAAYEDIIRLYPDTPASREAAANIQVLMRQPAAG